MKKFAFGLLITLIGLVFSGFCFMYAVMNPVEFNGTSNLFVYFLCNDVLLPFILSFLTMNLGIYLCWVDAFQRNIRKPWLSERI